MATRPISTHEFARKAGTAHGLPRRPGLTKAPANRSLRAPGAPAGTRLPEPEKQRALVAMLPLVKRVAYQMREHLPPHVDVEDLVGNGTLGLVDAVSKFDSTKHVKLDSYARHRIRGSILDGLRSLDPVSRDMRKKSRRVEQVYRKLEARLGRPASDEEVATALQISLPQWHNTLREMQGVGVEGWLRTGSVAPTIKRAASEETLVTDSQGDPFQMCYRAEQRAILRRALWRLRERDRLIIALYYQEELTMRQIAARLNVDESRVSQLHGAALVRLKACVQGLLKPQRQGMPGPERRLAMAASPCGATGLHHEFCRPMRSAMLSAHQNVRLS